MIDERTETFLRTLPFFNGMAEADVHAFFQQIEVKEYPKGHMLFFMGDPANRFFVIMSGWVKLFRSTSEGVESVLAVFSRGDVFGEASIFDGANYPFSVEIAETTKVLEIPATLLRERAKQNPDIMGRMMASMSREMTKLQMENEHLSIMTAAQRVGCLLLQLSSNMIGKGGTFTFPYDKSLAASRLGIKPETFSRALAQLKPHGVQVKGSDISIGNFETLVTHVCTNCSSMSEECHGSRGFKDCNQQNCASCAKTCRT